MSIELTVVINLWHINWFAYTKVMNVFLTFFMTYTRMKRKHIPRIDRMSFISSSNHLQWEGTVNFLFISLTLSQKKAKVTEVYKSSVSLSPFYTHRVRMYDWFIWLDLFHPVHFNNGIRLKRQAINFPLTLAIAPDEYFCLIFSIFSSFFFFLPSCETFHLTEIINVRL